MRNSLLRNDGHGVFTDVTKAAGLANGVFATHSAAWADYDNDGWVDLYVGHELAPSRLYRNKGDGTFEDVSVKAGVAGNAFTKGVSWGDYDNDGFPDLYASNMFGDNFLYRNQRRRHLRGSRGEARRAEAVRQLPDVVVRLRQRRLARSLRRGVSELGRGVRQALPRTGAGGGDPEAVSQRRTRRVHRRVGGDGRGPRRAVDGRQRRRHRQRRLPRRLSRHRGAVVRVADPEHPAAQRRRPALRRRHRSDRHRAPAEGPRRRLRRPRSRRRRGHRAQRRRRGARRSLRRRGVREPRHARPALGRPAAGRRPVEPGGDRREDSRHRRCLLAAGAPPPGCATARCRAAARSARTATSSTSAWAAPPASSRSRSPGRPARPGRCSATRRSTRCSRSGRVPRRQWSDHRWRSVSGAPAARYRRTSTDRSLLRGRTIDP